MVATPMPLESTSDVSSTSFIKLEKIVVAKSTSVVKKPKVPNISQMQRVERDKKVNKKYEQGDQTSLNLSTVSVVPKSAIAKKTKVGKSGVYNTSVPIVSLSSFLPAEQPQKKTLYVPPSVALSERDRAQQLCLSHDQMEVTGVHGGYRMVRATHGVHNGAYYWEVEILPPLEGPNVDPSRCHTRVGWSTRQGELQAPVGNDIYGYGYRDISGSKVHGGLRDDRYGEEYGPGDIIGCFLNLDVDDIGNNQMRFFKNGRDQGVAYRGSEIPLGVYIPACSLYMQARLRVNFGPSFILKHDIFGANAVSEVQPMNPEDRKAHDARIAAIRMYNPACLALSSDSVHN